MPVQKTKCPLAVDGVRSVEKFNFRSIAYPQLVVKATHLGEFIGHPFIRRDIVIVTSLHRDYLPSS